MKVRQEGRTLIVEEAPVVVPLIFLVSAVILLVLAIAIALGAAAHTQPAWAALLLAIFSAAIGVLFFRRESNRFDGDARIFSWSKWTPFRQNGGAIAFDDITGVNVATTSTSETVPSCRITVHSETLMVPLTQHFSGSLATHEPVAMLIRGLVGLASERLIEDSLRAMAADGHKADAVRLLRLSREIGLTEAKQRIERLSEER